MTVRVRRAAALVLVVLGAVSAASCGYDARPAPRVTLATHSAATRPPPRSSSSAPLTPAASPARVAHPVLTRGGMWWGVDSYSPMSAASLANVRHWYVGGHAPQFWGRYLGGPAGVDRTELAFAAAHGIYVYLIVGDRNCSACAAGDACGNDLTAAQAREDAAHAVRAARRVHVPFGAVLFKDIEQVSSCRSEPTPAYLQAWHHALDGSRFRTGFYGNATNAGYDFPRAYCRAVADTAFRDGVVLAMNEPEPQLGARRWTIGPANAPAFGPSAPGCATAARTVIWQYGESVDDDNVTDVDQARPDVHGLIGPDGTVS